MIDDPAVSALPRILIADDDEGMRYFLSEALKKEGYPFESAADGREALKKLESGEFRIVIMDIKMPHVDGLLAMERMKERDPDLLIVLMTAFGSKRVAIEAMKKGAYDYFTKPFDLDEMRIVIRRAVERCRMRGEVKALQRRLEEDFPSIRGESAAMRKVFGRIQKVADSDVTVLVTGESGTGKELVAREIHQISPRRGGPFLTVNCASIPEDLLEAELFGHEKGAFTGAHQQKPGKFELADGGTLFLDEVGEMPTGMQTKILRVLQEREFDRLGGVKPIAVNIRVIAATNKDLAASVRGGDFREDLFYRLNVVNIHLPPLRERPEDIPVLAEAFLKRYAEKFRRPSVRFGDGAVSWLARQRWPGNVRELENLIQRAVVLSESEILDRTGFEEAAPDRGGSVLTADERGGLLDQVEKVSADVERKMILNALREVEDHRGAAARRLGISRKHLYNKMKKHGLT